jgi:hypothetical protein
MDERLSKAEIRKDAVQNAVEAAAGAVGQVATIITTAVKDVAGTVGGFATELFEIRDAARRASEDAEGPRAAEPRAVGVADPDVHPDPDAAALGQADPDLHRDPDAPTV